MKKIFIILMLSILFIPSCTKSTDQQVTENTEQDPFIRYSESAYNQAISENKVIFIDFYASWCPICRAEDPSLKAALSEVNNPNFIAFRSHYNDGDTNKEDEAIQKEFGITYQHTKVLIKDRKLIARSLESFNKQDTSNFINQAL